MRRSCLFVLRVALVAALLPLPATSWAAPPTADAATADAATADAATADAATVASEAATRFSRGLALFEEGSYRAALIEFDRANELAPNYRVLYNIGQVHYQLGEYADALESFEQYLTEGVGEIEPKRREAVAADIAKLKQRVGELTVRVDTPGLEILVDDLSVGRSPLPAPLRVSAGRRKITVVNHGQPLTKRVDIAGGAVSLVRFELGGAGRSDSSLAAERPTQPGSRPAPAGGDPASMAPSAAAAEPADHAGSVLPWLGWGLTGALTAGAVVVGVLALDASSELQDTRARPTDQAELDHAATKTTTLAVTTDVLIGAAAVVGVAAAVLTVLELTSADDTSSDRVRAAVRAGPAGVEIVGQF